MKMENGKVEEADLGVGGSFVKVMSDEQLELLRRQISLYAVISEQLASMHNSFTSQQQLLSGLKMGSIGYDPVMGYCGNKMGSRQRWSPSPAQLQLLEQIFDKGNGTPTKLKIKEITSDLSQHGQVSETNVYNWFQNRRARSKRKQPPCNEQQPQPNPNPNPAPQQTYDPDYFPCSDDFPTWSQNDCIYGLQSPSWPGFGLHEP